MAATDHLSAGQFGMRAREAHEALYAKGFTTVQADQALFRAYQGLKTHIKKPADVTISHDKSGYSIG